MNHYQTDVIHQIKSKALHLEAAAVTIRGNQRRVNEDTVFHHTDQKDTGETLGLFALCDGMGGHEAGEVASQMAIQTVASELGSVLLGGNPPDWPALHHWVRTAVAHANDKIWEYAHALPLSNAANESRQLGTTMTLTLIYGDLAAIANVGDSRAYLWRDGRLTQITHDHSMVTELAMAGLLSAQSAANHPYRHVLTRALGTSQDVAVDLFEARVRPGDKFLLCSDGVWEAFPETGELAHLLDSAAGPDDLCWHLVEEAGRRKGTDDMSAITVYVEKRYGGTNGYDNFE